jgi:hypothetical protein
MMKTTGHLDGRYLLGYGHGKPKENVRALETVWNRHQSLKTMASSHSM